MGKLKLHLGEVSRMIMSPDGKYLISAGLDGTIFMMTMTDLASEPLPGMISPPSIPKESTIPVPSIQAKGPSTLASDGKPAQNNAESLLTAEEQLAEIVLVKKSLMESWRKSQDNLKVKMEEENNKVESSLRNEKYAYEGKIAAMEKSKTDLLNDLNRRYEELQAQEAEQKDENTQTMKKMELNHLQCMEELQTLYEKKLQYENLAYRRLEKEKGEMQSEYEAELKLLQKQNEEAIDKLLSEFRNNLGKIQEEYEDQKRTADGLKTQYEEKLVQTSDEHEAELEEMREMQSNERLQLQEVIATLKNDIETIRRQIRRIEEEREAFKGLTKKAIDKKNRLRDVLEKDKIVRIKELEEAKREVQESLKKKEDQLYKYKFRIKDLQKTKQVLTHRTQEMKASLEPKE